ncbi:MAG: hypothetical protein WD826_04805 [Actinomycetota bacterium]
MRRAFPTFLTLGLTVVLVASLASAGLLAAPGVSEDAAQAIDPACPTPLGCGEDFEWALDLERKIADNMWDGQVYEVDYAAGLDRTRENITSASHYGDSALWTGTYLAAQSFRYQVAKRTAEDLRSTYQPPAKPKKRHGKKPKPEPDPALEAILAWETQRDEAKARVTDMVAKFHVLTNISQNWNHTFEPNIDDPNFGGGVIAGEPGYLMRACIPTSTPQQYRWSDASLGLDADGMPENPPYTKQPRVFGPLPFPSADHPDRVDYFCEDGTSRDAYAGTTFGLLTAFDLVGPDDPQLQSTIGDDLITLVTFARKYLWSTPRPHGRISLPIPILDDLPECTFCGHDFENFISPLFIQVPLARLNMANAARHVAQVQGRSDAAVWDAFWTEEVASNLPVLALSMEIDSIQPNDGYYKYNLHHLTGYNVVRTAPDADLELAFKQAISVMDKTTGDDFNAHFETITFSMTGDDTKLEQAITHLREWRDYRRYIDTGAGVDNRSRCDEDLECVPQDQYETIPDGADPIVVPGTSGNLRARRPLEVAKRPPTDFLWQRPPTQLNGQQGALHQAPGIDYLLPYWMLRYYTEVDPPAAAPFPAYPGPAHA